MLFWKGVYILTIDIHVMIFKPQWKKMNIFAASQSDPSPLDTNNTNNK